jgi:intein-encoded DNA endonuclease-like protein
MSKMSEAVNKAMKEKRREFPVTPDLAYVLGVLWGDGSAQICPRKTGGYYYKVSLLSKSVDFIQTFKRAVQLTINTKVNECIIKQRMLNGKAYGPYIKVETNSMSFCEWYKIRTLEDIATEITNAGPKPMASFIRGFFDSDGTAYFKLSLNATLRPTNREIKIYKTNRAKLEHCQNMLEKLQITSQIKVHRVCTEKWKTCYVLRIFEKSSQCTFIQLIGSNVLHKKETLNKILMFNTKT